MKSFLLALVVITSLTAVLTILGFIENHKSQKGPEIPSDEAFILKELIKTSITNECQHLNDPLVYSGSDSKNIFNLFNLVTDECLVFRFSGEACNTCVDFVIQKLKERFPDYSENRRILLIGSNINKRVKDHYYDKPVLSYCSENIGLPFEDYNIPFLFIIDHEKICKMIFIPEKASPEFTDLYLETVFTRYFSGLN
jgi:hypothetical protein